MTTKPTPQQLAWQEAEMTMFLHFGINTFMDREWGDGTEDPALFHPPNLDARQWARVARDTGFEFLILTAKHHDGFCLWPSEYTEHSVKNSPWREGHGDVVREFVDACREFDRKAGLYLSPWDRHELSYGDSPAYNQYFRNQLTELLTHYGEIAEVWFDGACGEGPNGKRQEYDWHSYYQLIRQLQPDALIAICGPDIRWVGNEDGVARETEWSVQEANPERHMRAEGEVWYPAECDVSIRPGWFWHASEDAKVKSLEHLLDIYYKSVGRNSVLLLNVPPNREGLLADPDVQRLMELRSVLDRTFDVNLAQDKPAKANSEQQAHPSAHAVDALRDTYWAAAEDARSATLEVVLGQTTSFDVLMIEEYIALGQRVESYSVEAFVDQEWREISRGTTIGHRKLDRVEEVTASRIRFNVHESRECPLIRRFGLYRRDAG